MENRLPIAKLTTCGRDVKTGDLGVQIENCRGKGESTVFTRILLRRWRWIIMTLRAKSGPERPTVQWER